MLNLDYLPDSPDTGGWKIRHLEAVREPRDAFDRITATGQPILAGF